MYKYKNQYLIIFAQISKNKAKFIRFKKLNENKENLYLSIELINIK